jgi:hypothetical protein
MQIYVLRSKDRFIYEKKSSLHVVSLAKTVNGGVFWITMRKKEKIFWWPDSAIMVVLHPEDGAIQNGPKESNQSNHPNNAKFQTVLNSLKNIVVGKCEMF